MKSVRALIIDDSSVMRTIVERALRQGGLQLSELNEAGNGVEALALLDRTAVDLILCDINMPVMDGLEFVKQLKGVANARGVPVVMITTEGRSPTWCRRCRTGRAVHSQAVHARSGAFRLGRP